MAMLLRLFVVGVCAASTLLETSFGQERRSGRVQPGNQSLAQEIYSPLPSSPNAAQAAAFRVAESDLLPSLRHLETDWNVKQDKIHWDTATTLAELSTLAYTDEHNRKLVLRLIGFDEVAVLDDSPMSGYIAMSNDVVVVAFRGTDMFSPRDWLADIDLFRQTSMGDGRKFHRGFQESYARFSDQIRAHLRDRHPK